MASSLRAVPLEASAFESGRDGLQRKLANLETHVNVRNDQTEEVEKDQRERKLHVKGAREREPQPLQTPSVQLFVITMV